MKLFKVLFSFFAFLIFGALTCTGLFMQEYDKAAAFGIFMLLTDRMMWRGLDDN